MALLETCRIVLSAAQDDARAAVDALERYTVDPDETALDDAKRYAESIIAAIDWLRDNT